MSQELTADQVLCLAYAGANTRAAYRAAFIIDGQFQAMVDAAHEPLLTRIKLAWWKEQGLSTPVAGTPIGDAYLHLGGFRPQVTALIAAWDQALDGGDAEVESAAARGAALFGLGAAVAGRDLTPSAERAAKAWGVADFAARAQSPAALALAKDHFTSTDLRDLRGALKPFGVLAALSKRDVECGFDKAPAPGSPRRMLTAFVFALFNFRL